MARIKMVTRTVKCTIADVMYVNTDTAEVYIHTETYTGDFKDETDLKKFINKTNTNENCTVVKVTITGTEEKLYGMSETEFLKYAQPLPNRPATK